MAIVLHHEVVDDRNWEEIKQITHNKRCLLVRNAKILASQKPVYMSQGLSKKSIVCALKSLYQYCAHRPDGKFSRQSIMSNMFGLYLTRGDCHTMAPTEWVSNIVISFVGKFMIEEQRRVHVVKHLREKMVEEWRPEDMRQYVHPGVLGYILHCQMIFAPTLFEDHWSCYVLDWGEKKLYVLDSLARVNSFAKKCLDEVMVLTLFLLTLYLSIVCYEFHVLVVLTKANNVTCLYHLFHINQKMEMLLLSLDGTLRKEDVKLEIFYAEVPEQPNIYDCGVYVLKFMELWEPKKEMPYFKYEQILKFRQDYICDWVRHPENEVRETVLKGAKLWGKLR